MLREASLHAKEAAYARCYAEHPPIEADNAAGESLVAQAATELRVEEESAGLPPLGGQAAYQAWKRRHEAR